MGNAPMSCGHVETLPGVDVIVGDAWSQSKGSQVLLNVYHLDDTWSKSNELTNVFGIGGAFHAGIEVHGKEWTYGYETGVTCGPPRSHPVHVYHESVLLGETDMSAFEVHNLIQKMAKEWIAEEYQLLEHNCCNFSDALSQELVGEAIPTWVTRFPAIAAQAAAHLSLDVNGMMLQEDDCSPVSTVTKAHSTGSVRVIRPVHFNSVRPVRFR